MISLEYMHAPHFVCNAVPDTRIHPREKKSKISKSSHTRRPLAQNMSSTTPYALKGMTSSHRPWSCRRSDDCIRNKDVRRRLLDSYTFPSPEVITVPSRRAAR